jgi:hypothetical protein
VPGDNQLKLHGEFSCAGTPGALPVVLKAQALGCADYDLRAAAREAGANRASPPLLAARFRPVAGSFALSHQRFTPVSALNENFSWEAEGTSLGSASASGGQWLLLSPFWLPKEWDQALHSRKTPLFLNQGYPLTLEEEFDFTLPPRAQPAPLPGVSENKTGPLRWRIEWQMSGDHKLSASLRAELARGELAAADTPVLQKQLCDLLAALASGASFSVLP